MTFVQMITVFEAAKPWCLKAYHAVVDYLRRSIKRATRKESWRIRRDIA